MYFNLYNTKVKNVKKIRTISLFSGCGGLDYGFINQGFEIIWANDIFKEAVQTYKYNIGNHIVLGDITKILNSQIPNDFDVLLGGFPCQGFSIANKHRSMKDERNFLYKEILRIVKDKKPKFFVLENVKGLLSLEDGAVIQMIVNDFKKLGYLVQYKLLNSAQYGIPQKRQRVFLVGSPQNVSFEFPEPTHKNPIPVKDAISDLPEFSMKDGEKNNLVPQSDYQKKLRLRSEDKIYNHQITNHTDQTKRIISLVPDGGNYKNLPINLQKTRKVNIAWTRLNSNQPSFTIDTGHNHHFHYLFNRVPTARESARLQSFPDNFVFCGNKTSQLKQIGNAVPPLLGEVIAQKIKSYLN